jgi:DNA-binding NarL/FixJ family response regulator
LIRVVVAGIDRLSRAGVVSWLAGAANVAGEGTDLAALVRAWRPVVGVVVGTAFAPVDVPVLAVVPDAEAAREALGAGARGVVAPEPRVLIAAIAAVAAGLSVHDPTWAEVLLAVRPPMRGDTLTGRERQVLELMAEGRSNKEIAALLDISGHTAKFHVGAVLDKLGAQTRAEAVVLAARRGWLIL